MKKLTVKDLTIEQKLRLLCGKDCWHNEDFDGLLPKVRLTDATMGVRMPEDPTIATGDKPSVCYPSVQMLADTWNNDIVRTYAECVADDCLDAGADVILGPGVNIKRNPLCGRNFEYFSEDPYLAGTMAREYISAMQAEGVGATLKHFCANNLEYNRLQQSSDVDERTLREIYYKPFEIALAAKPVAVMSSYNRINGVYGSEYKKGYDVLRNEYGFDGLIMSDWDAVRSRTSAAKAGLDLEMPFKQSNYDKLVEDYRSGKITEEEIDKCAARVLEFVYRVKNLHTNKPRKHTLEQRIAFTQTVAEEGIVLLKNNGVLPLDKNRSLSMCGFFARPSAYNYKRPHIMVGGGSGKVQRITPMFDMLKILEKRLGKHIPYEPAFHENYTDGVLMCPGNALDDAAASDVALVFAGTGSVIESEARDRASMALGVEPTRTILDVASVNSNTVVVLFAGAAIDMSEWIDKVAAVVYVGFPGEMGGEALANVLTGAVNPSGKLSETFPLRYADMPCANTYIDGKVTCYEEQLDVGYRYFDTCDVPVLFPFGHGLSYTEFKYDNIALSLTDDGVDVAYTIANVGDVDGKEVSQVYVKPLGSYVYRPLKELKWYSKDFIAAGKSKQVVAHLDMSAFAYWSTARDCWYVEDGVYEIVVAASVADERLTARVKVADGKLTIL